MSEAPTIFTKPTEAQAALLDVRQVASILACSTRTCYRLADGGLMPRPRKLGALVRWSKADLDAWISGGCRRVTSTKGAGQ